MPQNEEDIQCFLYHGLVLSLQDARAIRTKASSGSLKDNTKHFPDIVLGTTQPEVVVEIKFQTNSPQTVYAGCRRDVQKLKEHYDSVPHYLVLFDVNREYVFIDEDQLVELKGLASANCKILHYPIKLSALPGKGVARIAIETMRNNGMNFSDMGKKGAATRKKNAQRIHSEP